jgi:cysteine-rich repeat protein
MKRGSCSLIAVMLLTVGLAACSGQDADTRCDDLKDRASSCGLGTVSDTAICTTGLLARYDQIMDGDCSVFASGKADGFDDSGAACKTPCFLPDDVSDLFCVPNEGLVGDELAACCADADFYAAMTAQCNAPQSIDAADPPAADAGSVVDTAAEAPAPDLGPVCGDGVREGDEQCDDGNTVNLDGCDDACRFEQDQRLNYLSMQYQTDSTFCTKNAFGQAITGQMVRDTLQQVIDDSIKNGVTSIMYKMMDLDDLTGTDDPSVTMGWMTGIAVEGNGYDGTDDLDWWYTVDPSTIDAQRNPLAVISGSLTSGELSAGPGNLTIGLDFAGAMAYLDLSNAKLWLDIGASSAPLTSSSGTPGHLAGENLDPALVSFASAGTGTYSGKLCGAISAYSLDQVPIPSALVSYCSPSYTASDSMLDVLIGGCSVFFYGQMIKPTQPDSEDPTVPPAGSGPPYTLYGYSGGHKADGCTCSNGRTVSKTACFQDAAYSSYMRISSGRVIIK